MTGYENGAIVATCDFEYPDEGDAPAPTVRDTWIDEPLALKCRRRSFATLSRRDDSFLDQINKRLEILSYALRDAVERMDLDAIFQLAQKAIRTRDRLATEQLARSTPPTRELHDDIVIHDDPELGRVIISLPKPPKEKARRWLRMCGFGNAGDGVTYTRRRTFLRGENITLETARDCVARLLGGSL
jgi:hypothetical protein